MFFDAVNQQARDRDAHLIPDLESYISVSHPVGAVPLHYEVLIDSPDAPGH